METYNTVADDLARRLTEHYSTSFSLASRLYSAAIRPHIYAIYGMVRVADEIVDTYQAADRAERLELFYQETVRALESGFSTNPLLHAFALTARRFDIGIDLVDPFFVSMRMDLTKTSFSQPEYDNYIYGSAEVIGLMCLKVFCNNNSAQYEQLKHGAQTLGSAYQKVNFLRDLRADHDERGRIYFPGLTFESFDDAAKNEIIGELTREFNEAHDSIRQLPASAKKAVFVSFKYYGALLAQLERMSADQIKTQRAHVSNIYKLTAFATAWFARV